MEVSSAKRLLVAVIGVALVSLVRHAWSKRIPSEDLMTFALVCQIAHGIAGVARLALRLIGPGDALGQIRTGGKGVAAEKLSREVISDLVHAAVAIVADHAGIKHRPAQTLGVLAGVALVTGLVEFFRHIGIDRWFAGGSIDPQCIIRGGHIVREQIGELAVVSMHYPGVGVMDFFVSAVGIGIARTQGPQMRQVKSRGVMADLARDRRGVL